MLRAKGRDLDLNAKKKKRNPSKKSKRGTFAYWPTAIGKDESQSTYGWADLHSTTTATATTGRRRDETRREPRAGGSGAKAAASVAWRIQASTSREREGPALALAGGLVPGPCCSFWNF